MSLINPLANAHTVTPLGPVVQHREEKEQNLRRDQVVRATVLEGGLSKVLLETGNRQYWVSSEIPLKTGQRLTLQTVPGEDGSQLRLVGQTLDERLTSSLHLLGEKLDPLPLLAALLDQRPNRPTLPTTARETLEAVRLLLKSEDQAIDGRLLKSLGRMLGLDFEANLARGKGEAALASLKGALLTVLGTLPDPEGSLGEKTAHLLQVIEAVQLCRAKLATDGIVLVPLPLPFLEIGYLLVERHGRPHEEEEPQTVSHRITLLLQLDELGCLKVDLLKQKGSLYVRIDTDNSRTLAELEAARHELRDQVQAIPVRNLAFGLGAEPPARHLGRMLLKGKTSAVDARI